jgi:tetratricopeptide (TPR) repeat protein
MSRDDHDVTPASPPALDKLAAAAALVVEGRRAVDAEDYPAARAAFERELALRRKLDDVTGVIYALIHVAWVCRIGQGEVAAARPLLEEALAIAQERSPQLVGVVVCNLGDQALSEVDFETADRLLRECLPLLASFTRDAGSVGGALEGLAMAAAGQGQWTRALRLFGAASSLREGAGIPQIQPAVVARFDLFFGSARAALGAEAAAAAKAQGRSLSLDEALAEALGEVGGTAPEVI